VDDDTALAEGIQAVLESRGYRVGHFDDASLAFADAEENEYQVVITDYQMPGMNGLDFLAKLHDSQPWLPIIMMTAFSTTERAIEATKKGAYDYLLKPFEMPALLSLIEQALESSSAKAKPIPITENAVEDRSIIGTSPAMQMVFKEIGKITDKSITVLIKGETGSGKELVARTIHEHSDRSQEAFIAINCAAIPDNLIESELFGHERGAFTGAVQKRIGRFEQAEGGTLFLDEVGDLPWQTQVKLLRVLQERTIHRVGAKEEIPVDVRVISATHRNLEEMIAEESFREDLFFRLNASVIKLPPLRERAEDIPALINHFLANFAREYSTGPPSIHKDAIGLLVSQEWPGNVRQLENVVRRALLDSHGFSISREIVLKSIESAPISASNNSVQNDSFEERIRKALLAASQGELEEGAFAFLVMELEKTLYQQAVDVSHGNQSKISKWLGVSRMTVRDKLDRYGLYPKRNT